MIIQEHKNTTTATGFKKKKYSEVKFGTQQESPTFLKRLKVFLVWVGRNVGLETAMFLWEKLQLVKSFELLSEHFAFCKIKRGHDHNK